MGNMLQNIFSLDSLQVKWLLSYHGNYKNINSVKSVCVLNTSDLNQTSLFELKVGCLSHHITLTRESIKSGGFPRHVM